MVQIKTKTFQITAKELQRLVIIDHWKEKKTLRILIIVCGVLYILTQIFHITAKKFENFDIISTYLLIYFTFVIANDLITPFFRSQALTSGLSFQNRCCEINEEFLAISFADGSLIKLNYQCFVKVIKNADYYFMHLNSSKVQVYHLPIAAFESEEDIYKFDELLKGKQLIKAE